MARWLQQPVLSSEEEILQAEMSVSVVIPNWNGSQRLETLLKQLPAQTSPIAEIIVVDNGSEDNSVEIAASLGARVIRFQHNLGFSAAVNRGVEECSSTLVAILNNDVRLQPDWLARLVAQLEVPGVWFATGKLLNANRQDTIDGSFDAISRGGCSWRCGHGRTDGPVWNQPRTIFLPPFTALVMKTELFRRVGGLDERLGILPGRCGLWVAQCVEGIHWQLRSQRSGIP